MKILEILNFTMERLQDPLWRERLEAPGLDECFCLVGVDGTDGSNIRIRDRAGSLPLQAGQMLLRAPGHRLRLDADAARPCLDAEAACPRPDGFVGAVFFKPDVSSGLQHVLQLLQRQRGAICQARVREFFLPLYEQFAGHSVFSLQAASHSLASMLYLLAENAARDTADAVENDYIERALELMNMRMRGALNLAELVDELHISEAHFIRLFRKKMQISPMKHFMRLKVHAAAAMIIQGAKIKDVAEQTGFYNDAHFSRQFKKYMGIPPREYKPNYVENLKTRHSENQKSLHFITHVLADFIDAIPDMVFFKDTFYVYRLCNTAFCDYVGRSKEDIYGHTDFTVFRPDIAAAYRYHDERVMRTLRAHANEEWVVYPDGRTHYVEAFKAPFFGPEQELLGMVAVCRDITERSDHPCPDSPVPHGRPKNR